MINGSMTIKYYQCLMSSVLRISYFMRRVLNIECIQQLSDLNPRIPQSDSTED